MSEPLRKAAARAVELLAATQSFIESNPVSDYGVFYDEAECDGNCLAEDCQACESTLRELLGLLEGK